jgi:hypothetical protein
VTGSTYVFSYSRWRPKTEVTCNPEVFRVLRVVLLLDKILMASYRLSGTLLQINVIALTADNFLYRKSNVAVDKPEELLVQQCDEIIENANGYAEI